MSLVLQTGGCPKVCLLQLKVNFQPYTPLSIVVAAQSQQPLEILDATLHHHSQPSSRFKANLMLDHRHIGSCWRLLLVHIPKSGK